VSDTDEHSRILHVSSVKITIVKYFYESDPRRRGQSNLASSDSLTNLEDFLKKRKDSFEFAATFTPNNIPPKGMKFNINH
jgi:hypothetical protein